MSASRGSNPADKENCNPNGDRMDRLTLGDGLEDQIIYHEDEALQVLEGGCLLDATEEETAQLVALAEMSQGRKKKLSQEAVRDKIKRNRDKISKAVAQRARERRQKLNSRKAKEKLLVATKKPRSKGKLQKPAGNPSENGSKQRRVGDKTVGQKRAKEPSEKEKKNGNKIRRLEEKKKASKETAPKKHRLKPGTCVLREIRKFQKDTNLLIRKRPFSR